MSLNINKTCWTWFQRGSTLYHHKASCINFVARCLLMKFEKWLIIQYYIDTNISSSFIFKWRIKDPLMVYYILSNIFIQILFQILIIQILTNNYLSFEGIGIIVWCFFNVLCIGEQRLIEAKPLHWAVSFQWNVMHSKTIICNCSMLNYFSIL